MDTPVVWLFPLCYDTPGGGGKVPLYPEYELSHDNEGYKLRNYEGRTFTYPEFDGQKTL